MVTGLIRGVNHFHSLLDKPIKLEISLKSSWRSSQLECKVESAKTVVVFQVRLWTAGCAKTEVNFSLYTTLLPLTPRLHFRVWPTGIRDILSVDHLVPNFFAFGPFRSIV